MLRRGEQVASVTAMDARALVEVLQGERARFVSMARARVGSDADAEDVVQRAMLRAAERADSLGDPARARAWFYRILRRAIVDQHRGRTRDACCSSDADVETLPDEGRETGKPCRCAERLSRDLRPAYADALRRIDVEGQDPADAATALGITVATFYVRLHRARHALRERVEKHCGVSSMTPCLDCSCTAHGRCGDDAHPAGVGRNTL